MATRGSLTPLGYEPFLVLSLRELYQSWSSIYQAHPKPSNLISPGHPTLVISSFIITETSPAGTRRGFRYPVSGYQRR